MFVGLDGCRQGWVAVALDESGAYAGAAVAAALNDLVGRFRSSLVIGVDMPLSLADAGSRKTEPDDEVARVPCDDLPDAAAVAWSARRIHLGKAGCVPEEPEGTPGIWFWGAGRSG